MRIPLIVLIILLSKNLLAQHEIRGKFTTEESFEMAILYEISTNNLQYKTHAKFNNDGQFVMALDSTYNLGVYRLVYGLPQEIYNFDLIYNGKEDIEFTFNSATGVIFSQSEDNIILKNYNIAMSKVGQDIDEAYQKSKLDTLEVLQIFKRQRELQYQFENKSRGLMASAFIQASKRYVPKHFEPLEVYIKNVKSHYFDAVDFQNKTLKSSKFFMEQATNFLFGFQGNQPTTIESLTQTVFDLDQMLQASADTSMRYSLLTVVMSQLIESNYEAVALNLSNTILKPLAEKLQDAEGLKAILDFELTALGAKAPNFEIQAADSQSPAVNLHDLKWAETYVLIFWSSTCSHCMNEMPVIQNTAKTNNTTDLSIIAVALENDPYKWNNLRYTWTAMTHVLALGKWDHPLVQLYNIPATPHFLVLDANKIIMAKPQNLEELLAFIQK